jgi:hypothetical protein
MVPIWSGRPGRSSRRLGVRIQLAEPWCVSDGELLAVILDRPSEPRPQATLVGPDPGAGRCTGALARYFPRAVAVLPDIDGRHTVVGHEVTIDPHTGGCVADIELAASFGYRPGLRLVLARYRPDVFDPGALSAFVTTDPVWL